VEKSPEENASGLSALH